MKLGKRKGQTGFSLIELMVAMVILLSLLAIVSTMLSRSTSVRARESRKTDALTSAQAALNILSREIANAGYGIYDNSVTRIANNGLVYDDSGSNQIHFRANLTNTGPQDDPVVLRTNDPGEDVTYFFDAATESIVRYDPNDIPQTSVVVNGISNVTFEYFDYVASSSTPVGPLSVPTPDTGRVRINVTVQMDPVVGQPDGDIVSFTSEVTLRNSNYMLRQY
ncbi:MAG: type II secretion system protein [Pyrinomonadaceae bacterium]|nr:type II secretion system protein [Pyrinomonadaceae bacterium]